MGLTRKTKPIEKTLRIQELDRIAKMLVRRDFELMKTREEQEEELQEMDRIAKMLARRDFELMEKREELEKRIGELEKTREKEQILRIREKAKSLDIEIKVKELEEIRIALTNMLEDVEEARGRAEEETKRTLAIVNNFADGLMVFNKEGKLILINTQAEDFFDVKSQELIGKSVLELNIFPTVQPLIKLLGGKIKGVFRKELPIRENLTLEVSTVSMMSEGKVLDRMVILHDITREKLIEKMKTEFVSVSAHQLRTPLSAIKWTLRMLLDGDLGEMTPEQKNFIEKTYWSNERMITLINDLLDVTRIEEGRYLYRPALTDFEPVIQFVIDSFGEEIKRKNIKCEFKKPEKKLPEIIMDVEKIKIAIQNLLDNAVRYTPLGGNVIISLKYGKNEIEFSITDNGVGIPESQKQRVFSRFFRGVNVIRLETEGTGLGLYIAKNIIETHGGRIWFESEEGKGTTFYFTLPVKKELEEFSREF